jgi:hydrogenase maturation protease
VNRILIAGIGNIFLGDDAFGVEVLRELQRHTLPAEARAIDFGIRGYDLACALTDDYDAAILVDATRRGDSPGTVYLIQPDVANFGEAENGMMDGHGMDPLRVLQIARSFGKNPARLYLVGCEPEKLDSDDGCMGLSAAVQAAVPQAVEMINSLVQDLLRSKTTIGTDVVPA